MQAIGAGRSFLVDSHTKSVAAHQLTKHYLFLLTIPSDATTRKIGSYTGCIGSLYFHT
jgi:hypothetical protein